MKESKEDVPQNSRIFILHNRNATKDELRETFQRFGEIEDVWMVRDKKNGENKGVTYVKYSKMSEAAHAVEEMNGVPISENSRPLKVIIANSRDEGSRKDDDIERFLRLFIMIPKDDSETDETLRKHFSRFGAVESVNILRNRETNASKGFAYVKYSKMSHAAKALEECDPKYKCVLAKPKEKRGEGQNERHNERHNEKRSHHSYSNAFDRPSYDGPSYDGPSFDGPSFDGPSFDGPSYDGPPFDSRDYGSEPRPFSNTVDLCSRYAPDQGFTKVVAFLSTKLSEELAIRLFELTPGLIFARMAPDVVSHRTQKYFLEYSTPESASFAVDRLGKFEYPVGEPILMKPELDWSQNSRENSSSKLGRNERERKRDYSNVSARSVEEEIGYNNFKKLASITNALEEATSIIKSHGLMPDSAARLCTAKLPPTQPMCKNEDGRYRLFIVCQPEAPPLNMMKDVFCRFGNLVDAYLIPGKNYGYVHYASLESANVAMGTLHGEELCGNRLKVLEADPPRNDNKRGRYD